MSLNPRYVTSPSLQSYFVDKDNGFPLAGGRVYFFRDNNRTQYKSVYELQGNEANYTYSPLPNPVILSAVGTIQDNNGNDVIPYYYPFDANGDTDLYYIAVYNSLGVLQFTRQAWPNPNIDNVPDSSDNRFNYIPNGQLLAHTVLPDNALVPGSNIIAQGGFSIELPDTATSVNTLEFITEQYTQAPPQSPRYVMQFTCSTFDASEAFKNIRVKFTDVNKFSTKPGQYTFAFWAVSNVALPVAIQVYKYFGAGGSPAFSTTQELTTIRTDADSTLYQFTIDFGLNNGKLVGAQDDFVAIDIALPTNIGFQAQFSDFVLVDGAAVPVLNFPVETDADMMARGVMGWADKVDPNGYDLYLPPILTKRGMTWDSSQICTVGMDLFPIDDPTSTSPSPPQHNKMPCDGAAYIYADYAANGIPFARLGAQLIARNQAGNDLPLFGTGANFVSALVPFSGAAGNTVRIVYNLTGTGSVLASEGADTNITFDPMYIYGGSTTGTADIGLFSSSVAPATVTMIPKVGYTLSAPTGTITAFTITQINTPSEIRAFQTPANSYEVLTPAASTMASGNGRHFTFTVGAQDYYIWINVGGSQPGPSPTPSGIGIEVIVASTYSAQDMADVIREAISGFNATQLTMPVDAPGVGSGIQAGSHFLFTANPPDPRDFYVWFTVDGNGTDPEIPNRTGIQIALLGTYTATQCRDRIRGVINRYQYQAPDFRGMFFRAADPNTTWDIDGLNRWSYVSHTWGVIPGTYEYQNFLSHNHTDTLDGRNATADPGVGPWLNSVPLQNVTITSDSSGGPETRPVNALIYPFIRY